jgi:hypothetical protein
MCFCEQDDLDVGPLRRDSVEQQVCFILVKNSIYIPRENIQERDLRGFHLEGFPFFAEVVRFAFGVQVDFWLTSWSRTLP